VTPGTTRGIRIQPVDLLRGMVIVIMALDHVRDFFGAEAAQPTNLATTTVALFFTRWITHLCAPTFFLLTGTSAYLTLERMSKPELSRFLLSRGLWLIFLDLVVMRFALQFNFDYHTTVANVLWALGAAMVTLSGLIWLPMWAIMLFGAVLVAGHNALDGINANTFGALAPLWTVLHVPGILINTGRSIVLVAYVLIPWVGVTALGYALGAIYRWSPCNRRELPALRQNRRDVPITRPRPLPLQPAARVGYRPHHRLSRVAHRHSHDVPALPLVRPGQAQPQPLVAQLSLSRPGNKPAGPAI
jgi:uncharacterized membrane protein